MKLPRNVSAQDLIKGSKKLGNEVTRQTGSHIRISTEQNGQHHITIPNHDPLKIGTLSAILNDIASHFGISKEKVIETIL